MKRETVNLLRIALVLITFMAVLRGQSINIKPELPELIPYQIVPLDPEPDCRLEIGIRLIYPYNIENMFETDQEEALHIIYKRVGYEIVNPDKQSNMFHVDGKLYHLIRIPYTGSADIWEWK